jgi:hypothetical protein
MLYQLQRLLDAACWPYRSHTEPANASAIPVANR